MKKTFIKLLSLTMATALLATLCACASENDGESEVSVPEQSTVSVVESSIPESTPSIVESEPAESSETESKDDQDPSTPDVQPDDNDPTYKPVPVEDADGCFASDTGTKLNLVVNWKRTDDGKVKLFASLDSYSLEIGSRKNGLVIEVGGKNYTVDTMAINHEGGKETLPLGECEIEAASGDTVTVTYDFRGSYGGTELPKIVATGTIA